jgi:non-ribosomal peptide synthetase component F
LEIEDDSVRFDLTLWVVETPEGLRGRWTYRTELFDAETIRRMTAHWEMLLQSIVASPEARVQSLDMLTEEERKQKEIEEMVRDTVTTEKLLTTRRKTINVIGNAS